MISYATFTEPWSLNQLDLRMCAFVKERVKNEFWEYLGDFICNGRPAKASF